MRYFLIYKPYGMLSQFTPEAADQQTLADLNYVFPGDVYPVGRLDADSEGLLLLTNDKRVNQRLLQPNEAHERRYWVQVEGIPTTAAQAQLAAGVSIRLKGKVYQTRPAVVSLFSESPVLPKRIPPVRFRKTVPDSWLELRLTEGKNRQVRRMCAAVGYPVLRLVRVGIGKIELGQLQPGDVIEIDQKAVYELF
ncbi:MAG: pseudouridine synthase [Lewinellaceae bacterium]|nr:pseudouridine synthase [Saprospiraceae bacterium]MCB9315007.1 pseudouridine synthase [Lewinellaceae bacterium]MCB9329798.1 pseudouridine synthase [Lewinellaceae bacterium]